MIYSDAQGKYDIQWHPAEREEVCINCNRKLEFHFGWHCDLGHLDFYTCPPNKRFLTKSMKDSVQKKSPWQDHNSNLIAKDVINRFVTNPITPDLSDWKTWAHNREGECACGIAKQQCEYHR